MKDAPRQEGAIDRTVDDRSRKGRLDQRRRFAAIEVVNGLVGIEDRNAMLGKKGGDRRFAHGDRAGEAEDEHQRAVMLCSTAARSAAVTVGRLPNQRSKPGAAWWRSMPSPSTPRRPRARAAASNGVSSGT